MNPSSKPKPETIQKLLRANRAVVVQTDPAERKPYQRNQSNISSYKPNGGSHAS